MPWEILSARFPVEGGVYQVTLAVDSDRHKAYIARFCADPRTDKTYAGVNMCRNEGLGHAEDLFEATEICNRDRILNHKIPR